MFWKRIYPYNIHICTFVYNIYGYIYIQYTSLSTYIYFSPGSTWPSRWDLQISTETMLGESSRWDDEMCKQKHMGDDQGWRDFFCFNDMFGIFLFVDFFCWHLCLLSYMCSCSFICCSFLFSDFAVFSCMVICFYMYWYILCFVATAEIHMLYQLETRNWVTRFDMIGIDWCRKAVYATNI